MVIASVLSDYILTVISALGSVFGSVWAIKAIVKHQMKQCDLRMEAFKEGLKHGEKDK